MSTLDDWADEVRKALGITEPIDIGLVLDLARDVAHAVARPAAPVTSYLLGLAVAHGAEPAQAAEVLSGMAREWPPA